MAGVLKVKVGGIWQEVAAQGPAGPQGPAGATGAPGAPGAAATPGGSTTQVQFNDSGVLGGDADLTWDKTANALSIGPLPALSGAIRIPYNTPLTARNSANTGDLALIQAAGGVVVVGNASVITKVVSGTHGIEINPSGWIYPVVDNGTDLGHATKRWKDVQVAGSVNIGTNPATTGAVRLANNSVIAARDVAGAADLLVAQIFTDNKIYVGSNANDAGLVLRSATAVEVNRGIKFPATAVPSAD